MYKLNDWAFDDIKKQMRLMKLSKIQDLYREYKEMYNNRCVEYVVLQGLDKVSYNDNELKSKEEECNKLHCEILIIATEIADRLTN